MRAQMWHIKYTCDLRQKKAENMLWLHLETQHMCTVLLPPCVPHFDSTAAVCLLGECCKHSKKQHILRIAACLAKIVARSAKIVARLTKIAARLTKIGRFGRKCCDTLQAQTQRETTKCGTCRNQIALDTFDRLWHSF